MSIKPWICNGSKTIIKDRWIDLHADDCELPDGTKISPFYVNTVPDFVVAVAITVDGEFIFVRQYRHGTRQILLELPAGCMEPTDANPAAGAARELFEETGYAGSEPVFLCKVAPNAACISNFAHCYLITDCKRVSGQHLDCHRGSGDRRDVRRGNEKADDKRRTCTGGSCGCNVLCGEAIK